MIKKNVSITLYGFWDDFDKRYLPSDGKIYFIFVGQIIGTNVCRLLRTVYIGEGEESRGQIESGVFTEGLNSSELLFYAVGDTTDNLADVIFALKKKFIPSLVTDEENACHKEQSIQVHIDGKVPRIYNDCIDFTVEA